MPVQMTRAQYEAKYGAPPGSQPVQITRAQYEAKYGQAAPATSAGSASRISDSGASQGQSRGVLENVVKRPLERLVLEPGRRLGEAVGSGLINVFGNEEEKARAAASTQQDKTISVPLLGDFLMRGVKSGKQIAGETLETAGYLAPVGRATKAVTPALNPIFAKGAGVAAASATGAGTGYAFDVGSKLQEGKSLGDALTPGVGTAAGAAIPILGAIVGKLPKKLEEINLRMTPTERANLEKQGKDVAQWMASKKIMGNPEARYQKVNAIYDDLEKEVGRIVDTSKVTFPKASIIDKLKEIPGKYVDNLSEYEGVVAKVDRMIKTLETTHTDSIAAKTLNKMKRAEWKNAYNKNGSAVINEVSDDVGRIFKEILDNALPELKPVNFEYGNAIVARRVLHKATTRAQTGLVGKLLGTAAGAGVGGAIGGGVGAAGGAIVGEQIAAKALGTATRSRTGAAIQSVSDILGKGPIGTGGSQALPQKGATTLLQNLLPGGKVPTVVPQSTPSGDYNTPEELEAALQKGVELGQKFDPTGALGTVGKVSAQALSKIRPDDVQIMTKFIDHARIKTPLSDEQFAQAEKLAELFGISMDKGLAGVANAFEKVLEAVKGKAAQGRDALGRFVGLE